MKNKDNQNPTIHQHITPRERDYTWQELDNSIYDPVDSREIFDFIRDINDPEHPLTLEDLNVVNEEHIEVDDISKSVKV